jgi:hypothetical protein
LHVPGGLAVTGTREGRPLCDEIVTPSGGLCTNTIWREGKCALHWGNSAAVRRPDARPPRAPKPPAPEPAPAPVEGPRPYFRGGRPIEYEPTGMEAVWEACRRWDRLYDATLRRPRSPL